MASSLRLKGILRMKRIKPIGCLLWMGKVLLLGQRDRIEQWTIGHFQFI